MSDKKPKKKNVTHIKYQCCFCGKEIIEEEDFCIKMDVELNKQNEFQSLYTHSYCLKNNLHSSIPIGLDDSEIIYVKLLNEGTKVWRPVIATKVDKDHYLIDNSKIPDGEEWEFPPSTIVSVRKHKFQNGTIGKIGVKENCKI